MTEKDLMDMFYPGLEPGFFPDTEVQPDEWRLYSEEQKTCVFCERRRDQVPRLIIDGNGNGAICSDCIEELGALLAGPAAHNAWHEQRQRKFNKEIGDNPYKRP
jgi:hypothetical protein